MQNILHSIVLFLSFVMLKAKEPELPLCPTNVQYFPQNLPMHCRLPATSAPFPALPRKPVDYLPMPIPGFPGPIPGPIPGMIPGPMPGMIPGSMPVGPVPQPPTRKLPVVVMPFYSPDTKNSQDSQSRHKKHRYGYKRRPKHYYRSDEDSTDTDTSSDDSSDQSSEHGWWERSRAGRRSNRHRSKRKRHQNKDLLTPVLQYVTKDGYVIFEKQITKGEAKNWLGNKKNDNNKKVDQKTDESPNSKEIVDDNKDIRYLIRDEENVEVKTEGNPNLPHVHQKKISKRKPSKKHTAH